MHVPWAEKGSSAGKGESIEKAAVIGGGAPGMMTAVLAAGEKTEIHLYEKMKSWERSCLSQGKGPLQCDKRLPRQKSSSRMW